MFRNTAIRFIGDRIASFRMMMAFAYNGFSLRPAVLRALEPRHHNMSADRIFDFFPIDILRLKAAGIMNVLIGILAGQFPSNAIAIFIMGMGVRFNLAAVQNRPVTFRSMDMLFKAANRLRFLPFRQQGKRR